MGCLDSTTAPEQRARAREDLLDLDVYSCQNYQSAFFNRNNKGTNIMTMDAFKAGWEARANTRLNVEVSLRSNETETAEALECFKGVFMDGDDMCYSDFMMVCFFCSSDNEQNSWTAMWDMWAYTNELTGNVSAEQFTAFLTHLNELLVRFSFGMAALSGSNSTAGMESAQALQGAMITTIVGACGYTNDVTE